MTNNKFIEKVLEKLASISPRLECSITRLQIQIELQYENVQKLIDFFIILKPEYNYQWLCINTNQISSPKITLDITRLNEFLYLHKYLLDRHLLTEEEAYWLEDAIHDTLLEL
jgi:hypothetical protein